MMVMEHGKWKQARIPSDENEMVTIEERIVLIVICNILHK